MTSRSQDPVCGMIIDPATAAMRIRQGPAEYHFCSTLCGERFARDPARFLGEGAAPSSAERSALRSPAVEGGASRPRACPECGADVAVGGATILGKLTIPEFATMVRHRWRQRLGRRAYQRTHSDTLIRAVALHALKPESPVARISAEDELRREVARLRAEGLNRRHIQRELYHLSRAAADVLLGAGLERVATAQMIETIDRELLSLIEWKEQVPPEEVWALPRG